MQRHSYKHYHAFGKLTHFAHKTNTFKAHGEEFTIEVPELLESLKIDENTPLDYYTHKHETGLG